MRDHIVVMEGKVNSKKFSEEKANQLANYIRRVFNIKCEVKKV